MGTRWNAALPFIGKQAEADGGQQPDGGWYSSILHGFWSIAYSLSSLWFMETNLSAVRNICGFGRAYRVQGTPLNGFFRLARAFVKLGEVFDGLVDCGLFPGGGLILMLLHRIIGG